MDNQKKIMPLATAIAGVEALQKCVRWVDDPEEQRNVSTQGSDKNTLPVS